MSPSIQKGRRRLSQAEHPQVLQLGKAHAVAEETTSRDIPGQTNLSGTHRVIHLQGKLDLAVKFLKFLFDCGLWSSKRERSRHQAQHCPEPGTSHPAGKGLVSSCISKVKHSPRGPSGEDGLGCAKIRRGCMERSSLSLHTL